MNTTVFATRRGASGIALAAFITAYGFLTLYWRLSGAHPAAVYAVIIIAGAPYIIPIRKTWPSTRRMPQ